MNPNARFQWVEVIASHINNHEAVYPLPNGEYIKGYRETEAQDGGRIPLPLNVLVLMERNEFFGITSLEVSTLPLPDVITGPFQG